jgi:hypothetical protein
MSIVGVGVEPPQYALLGGECRCPRHANFPVRVNTVVGSAGSSLALLPPEDVPESASVESLLA